MISNSREDRFRGCLLGLAVGDAVGTTVEFEERGTFPLVTDMVGGGPFNLNPGEWTDDTSMALCLATSLLERKSFDARDQMDRYVSWWEDGYLSSNGECFDIGNTVRESLRSYKKTGIPMSGSKNPLSSGNGAIMRLAPIPMFFSNDLDSVIYYSGESSRTTHGSAECIDAARFFGLVLARALNGASKDEVISMCKPDLISSNSILEISNGNYLDKSENEIIGSGYVVKSLEGALWCYIKTDSYEEAVLKAVNLGDDTDTTAAICGQIAGAYYGETNIPTNWLDNLFMVNDIRRISDQLMSVKDK
ncbi:MAG: ADP-ribosylglycohydrolase family protein [Bacteroidetes bacterium]|jgi:ADP-ribosyl-[dinitrogen reductase] hydrolase|nr:ADP-ribosylglycohydrolase family protein [Bacteroidota bacterium]